MKRRPSITIAILFVLLFSLALIPAQFSVSAATSELFISEYGEGSSYNKYIEIYNGTGTSVDLTDYEVWRVSNGGTWPEATIPLAGTLHDGQVLIVHNPGTSTSPVNPTIATAGDLQISSGTLSHNGDDAIGLVKNGSLIDAVGTDGADPGSGWDVAGTTNATANHVLVRQSTVCSPTTDWDASRGTNPTNSEWIVLENEDWSNIGTHTADCGAPPPPPVLIINEVDADQSGTDSAEFVELFDGGVGNTALDGLALVLFNGSDDASYLAFDLDGLSTDGDGYFVLCGDPANTANCDLDVSPDTNLIQNGADAVALFIADAADFPNDTPVTTDGLLDALVYDTDDSDDAGLLVLLNPGQPQVNERDGGDGTAHSNQRCANGSGGARNTDTFAQYVPTPGTENTCVVEFTCGDPATFIHEVQGNASVSPLVGTSGVAIEGVVVGDFQTSDHLRGFFIQEENRDVDGDPLTSEGVFVYDGSSPAVNVNVGDLVRVEGSVVEYYGLTELTNVTNIAVCGTGAANPVTVMMPVSSLDQWEQYEGMLINIPQTLYATGNYSQGRYGEVDLSVDSRLDNPTNVVAPGAPAIALQAQNDLRRIQLEDGRTAQNPIPAPYMGLDNTLRAGDTLPGLTGVLHYAFDYYEVHPVAPLSFDRVNHRQAAPPDVGGTLRVASFNVLNYFTTLDDGSCPYAGGCRGADNADEFTRQRDKIIAAIIAMDADVIGLMEMENHPADAALQDLVNGLNDAAGAGTYAYVNTGVIGTDAIKVAFIYKPASVTPTGASAILDSSVDPTFIDTKNRPALAQSFTQTASAETFTAVVNHLKSKGSDCDDLGDPDTGDGQGNCNLTRTAAATALVNWLATDPTGSGDPDIIILGDLNAYAMEDPITAIKAAGYTNLVDTFAGPAAYSYVFMGQSGYLDHALANASLTAQVTGVVEWHINADEPAALDYNDYNQPDLYNPDPYRASDHDPVVIGLGLDATPPVLNVTVTPDTLWPANHKYVTVKATVSVFDNLDPNPTLTLVSITSNEPDSVNKGDKPNDIVILDDFTFELRAERFGGGDGRIYTITYLATDSMGNSTTVTATVTVPHNQ